MDKAPNRRILPWPKAVQGDSHGHCADSISCLSRGISCGRRCRQMEKLSFGSVWARQIHAEHGAADE